MDTSLPNLELISKYLHVSIDYLLDRTDDPDRTYANETLDADEQAILGIYRREGWSGVARISVERLSGR